MINQLNLFKTKRFLPIFLVQFLGAFNDNIFKNALVILITYKLAELSGYNAEKTISIAAGIFILPFFLFSATAGKIADKYDKAKLIRIIKFAEIILMSLAFIGFFLESLEFLMLILFLMGTQSSFFGPIKYSILPFHLKKEELLSGNALVEAGTFMAILIGTIIGGIYIMAEGGTYIISIMILAVAIAGFISSFAVPKAEPLDQQIRVNFNIFSEIFQLIKLTVKDRNIFKTMIGISWFWFIGAVFLSQFPIYTKNILGFNEEVVTFFLTLFSIGIATGSLFCNYILKGEVNIKFSPYAAFSMAGLIILLYFISTSRTEAEINAQNILPETEILKLGLSDFIAETRNIFISTILFLISIFGGIYIVPLYAKLQISAKDSQRARVIAANNIFNALFMTVSAILAIVIYSFGYSVLELFLLMAIITILIGYMLK
jgi:acyl-[acyl-carrier-protein]-phospholipid O-acyltransferase/long-chain-fatty-acid--[acyl-carrier-protein] ligase